MICLLLLYVSKCNKIATLTLLTLAVGFNGATFSGYINSHVDLAPNFAGTLMGITNSIATIPGFVAPLVAGTLVNEHVSNISIFFANTILMMFITTIFP